MNPELCDPIELTTLASRNRMYMCNLCGLWAEEEPTPPLVCLVKGGRKTDHDEEEDHCYHPGPCGGDPD